MSLFKLSQVDLFITKVAELEWVADLRPGAAKGEVKERMSHPVTCLFSIHLAYQVPSTV